MLRGLGLMWRLLILLSPLVFHVWQHTKRFLAAAFCQSSQKESTWPCLGGLWSLWVWHTAYSKYGECRQTFWVITSELNQSWKTRLGFTALAGERQRMSMSFLTSSLNLPGHSFEPFPRVLSPNTTEKSGYWPEITVRDTHYASVHSHHVLALLSQEDFVLTRPAGTTLLCGICRLHKFMENSSWRQGLWQGKTRQDRNAHA